MIPDRGLLRRVDSVAVSDSVILGVKLRPNRERKNGAPLVCSSLKSCRGTPDQRSTRRSPDHLHHGVLGEAKVAANRTPREAGVCSSTSALNGRWRLISAMYAARARAHTKSLVQSTREKPVKQGFLICSLASY